MRHLLRPRACTAVAPVPPSPSGLRRSIYTFHRFTTANAVRCGGAAAAPTVFPIELLGCRAYSTTTALLKQQLPTNSGTPSASSRVTGNASRKQAQQRKAAQLRQSVDKYGAVVEPELEIAAVPAPPTTSLASTPSPRTLSTPKCGTNSTDERNSSTACRRSPNASPKGVARVPKRGRRKQGAGVAQVTHSCPRTESALCREEQPPGPLSGLTTVKDEDNSAPTARSRGKKYTKESRGNRHAQDAVPSEACVIDGAFDPAESSGSAGTGTVALQPPPDPLGSTQAVYYTRSASWSTPRTEEQRIIERCSITKLIMISGSISFLFTTLPRSERKLKKHVKNCNQASLPLHASSRPLEDIDEDCASHTGGVHELTPLDGSSSVKNATAALREVPEKQFEALQQRLCAEQLATNTVVIHVREVEQLVPPPYLRAPPATGEAASDTRTASATEGPAISTEAPQTLSDSKSRGRRGRRQNRGRSSNAPPAPSSDTVEPASAPLRPVLSPVERLLALQDWKKDAMRRAKESQARYSIPAHYHAITRVRLHYPQEADLTVAMGSGWCKSINSLWRTIARSESQEERNTEYGSDADSDESLVQSLAAEDLHDDEEQQSSIPTFPGPFPPLFGDEASPQAAADPAAVDKWNIFEAPYAVRPLLTVCASCIPRREAWMGTCAAAPSTSESEPSKARSSSERMIPTVPRYSTRITVMLEHDDMDPSDLVSLAEMSTSRHAASSSTVHQQQRQHHRSGISIRGGSMDAVGLKADGGIGEPDCGDTPQRRPLHLYCFVQDAGEY